jgi:hypothetical protein
MLRPSIHTLSPNNGDALWEECALLTCEPD